MSSSSWPKWLLGDADAAEPEAEMAVCDHLPPPDNACSAHQLAHRDHKRYSRRRKVITNTC
ncbi:hypothetical protein GCM10010376_94950 [Streptomyces violaceusniger]